MTLPSRRFPSAARRAGALTVACLASATVLVGWSGPAQAGTSEFRNPLGVGGDPFITVHGGRYHLVMSEPGDAGKIVVRSAASLANLLTTNEKVTYTPPAPDKYEVWGPEIHRLDGVWYLYYTATDSTKEQHRLHVAVSSQGPQGPYTHKAVIRPAGHTGSRIGPSIMTHGGRKYLAFTGRVPETANGPKNPDGPGTVNGLYLAPLTNPWTAGTAVRIPATGGSDGVCHRIREAQSFLNRNGRTWMIYSACNAKTPDYRLMMKSIAAGADPLVPANWKQHPDPVFTRNDATGVWGPGSNAFFTSPDGTEDWIVFHAKSHTKEAFAPRTVRAQKFTWNSSTGAPVFGRPRGLGFTHALPSGDPGPGTFWINDDGRSNGGGTLQYSGTWNDNPDCGPQCFWQDDHWTGQQNATATFTFTGSRIALLSAGGPGSGIAAISIDGGPERRVDFYRTIRSGEVLHYLSPELDPSRRHTLRVRVLRDKHPDSTGYGVTIDRAEVYP